HGGHELPLPRGGRCFEPHLLGVRDAGGRRRADHRDRLRVPDGAERRDGARQLGADCDYRHPHRLQLRNHRQSAPGARGDGDADGKRLVGRTVTWQSSNTAAATANGSGLVSGVAAGSATITATSEGQSGTSAITVTPPGTQQFGHVFIVTEENTDYVDVTSSSMPYLMGLANQYGLATQYYANTHPSIGNYFELSTGQVLTND